MCGIVSASLFNRGVNNDLYSKINAYLITQLLIETEERGKDATGLFFGYENKRWAGFKLGIESTKWIGFGVDSIKRELRLFKEIFKAEENTVENTEIEEPPFGTYGDFIRNNWLNNESLVRTILGHCRKLTKGTARENDNNHPIIARPILGVHNGRVENDDLIFEIHKEDFKRKGDVDSEAIFQLMAHLHNPDQIEGADYLKDVASALQIGSFAKDGTAVVAMHENLPGVLYTLRKGSRPLEFCFSKELGIFLVISETVFLKKHLPEFWIAQMCDIPVPNFNFEYLSVNDFEGYIIDTNYNLEDVKSIKDIVSKVELPRVTSDVYKKPEPKTQTTHYGGTTYWDGKQCTGHSSETTKPKELLEELEDFERTVKQLGTTNFWVPENKEMVCKEPDKTPVILLPTTTKPIVTDVPTKEEALGAKVEVVDRCVGSADPLGLTKEESQIIRKFGLGSFHSLRKEHTGVGIDSSHFNYLKKICGRMLNEGYNLSNKDNNTLRTLLVEVLSNKYLEFDDNYTNFIKFKDEIDLLCNANKIKVEDFLHTMNTDTLRSLYNEIMIKEGEVTTQCFGF
jgi:hypothetical protein